MDCSFDRIQNLDGTFRSPKIRIGIDSQNSIVSQIRTIAKEKGNAEWYLAWAGLESEELFFWLFSNDSCDYRVAKQIFPKENYVYGDNDPSYKVALDYLTKKINSDSLIIRKDLEKVGQIGATKRLYKPLDIENAQNTFKKIGRIGEEKVLRYFEKEKNAGRIDSFQWMNKSRESGLPYDFILNKKEFIDVKTTSFDFEQYLYFSNQEINFICQNGSQYNVYRLYELADNTVNMRICSQCLPYMSGINKDIAKFKNSLIIKKASLQIIKMGILPKKCFQKIDGQIILRF